MAERDNFEIVVDGDQLNEGYYNGILRSRNIKEIYTGTGFNCAQAGIGSDAQSHELNSISSSELADADYVAIDVNAFCNNLSSNGVSIIKIKIEAKEIGGSYSDTLTELDLNYATGSNYDRSFQGFTWVHTLTSGEKSNGVQFRITTTGSGTQVNDDATLTNVQTVVRTDL